MSASRSIDFILNNQYLPEHLRDKLNLALKIRAFASEQLLLPSNDSYKNYVELDRKYVVWNVIATPEFSLAPVQSCFVFVGCLSYRGYFSKQDAQSYARKLKLEGKDTYVSGVTAYSTLGWFDDPVLSTMLKSDSIFLAKVIFHELAHQKTYLTDDTEFNEAFADSIATIGVKRWLESNNEYNLLQQYQQKQQRESEFLQLVDKFREQLEILYLSNGTEVELRRGKSTLFNMMDEEYRQIRTKWGKHKDYDNWFNDGVNNAKLAIVLTYRDLVSDFLKLFKSENENLANFYLKVSELADCAGEDRRKFLVQGRYEFDCQTDR